MGLPSEPSLPLDFIENAASPQARQLGPRCAVALPSDHVADADAEHDHPAVAFPSSTVVDYWYVDPMVQSLSPEDYAGLCKWKNRTLRYGSDATGANSGLVVLEGISRVVPLTVEHVFGSEDPLRGGDAARAFCNMNNAPAVWFDDMCARAYSGPIHTADGKVEYAATPSVDHYMAGTVCKDLSSYNTIGKVDFDTVRTTSSGKSSTTAAASLRFITLQMPATFILEFLVNLQYALFMMRNIRKLRCSFNQSSHS